MSTRVPTPLIPATQWTHGEPLDDLKLHRRIDLPLEQLGTVQRTFNTDLAAFYGYLPSGYSGAANTTINWSIGYDTVGLSDGFGNWMSDCAGLYLVSVNLGTAAAAAEMCSISRNSFADPGTPWSGAGPAVANGGPMLGTVLDLVAGDIIGAKAVNAFTTSTTGINWMFIQQLTWA